MVQARHAHVDHRLNRENLTGFHLAWGLGATVVDDIRVAMESLINAVAGVLSDNAVALGLDDGFDLVSNIPAEVTTRSLSVIVPAFKVKTPTHKKKRNIPV